MMRSEINFRGVRRKFGIDSVLNHRDSKCGPPQLHIQRFGSEGPTECNGEGSTECNDLAHTKIGTPARMELWYRVPFQRLRNIVLPNLFSFRTVWPSGLRRWLKAPVRKGVGSNPTAVIFADVLKKPPSALR